jgi:hypothetical protein
MCNVWTIMIILACIFFIIISIVNYKRCVKEYRYIRNLTSVGNNQVYPLPITIGTMVDTPNENLEIIEPHFLTI